MLNFNCKHLTISNFNSFSVRTLRIHKSAHRIAHREKWHYLISDENSSEFRLTNAAISSLYFYELNPTSIDALF